MSRIQILIRANTDGHNSITRPYFAVCTIHPEPGKMVLKGRGGSTSRAETRQLVRDLQQQFSVADSDIIEE